MTKSPDGSKICTASVDETIRFWDIFAGGKSSTNISNKSSKLSGENTLSMGMSLR